MKIHVFAVPLAALSLSLTSCDQAKESDDLAKAQECLDSVPSSDPGAASACFSYVEKYSSQQANILKCSILMTAGGLIEDKIVDGYELLKDDSIPEANRNAAYMAVLALDIPNASGGFDKAKAADVYCQATGVPGLKFLSGIILAGSAMAKTLAALPGGVEIGNITDPAQIDSAIDTLLDSTNGCTADPLPQECIDSLADIGTAVATLSVSYCANEKADAKVCEDINKAKEAAGNNATDIGHAMFCYLNKKTFDPNTLTCQ